MQVSALRTPLTRDATAAIFLPAYLSVFGEVPDRERAELLLALVWLENANGQSFIRFNWGNLSTSPVAGVDYWRPPWFDAEQIAAMDPGAKRERLEHLHQEMLLGKAPVAFRAFPDHETGAREWLARLSRTDMRPVLDAASSGDASRFAHAIFTTRYCPDLACRDAGASYARLRDAVHAADYFGALKKKPRAAAEEHLGSFLLERSLAALMCSRASVARAPAGAGDR